MEGEKKKGSFVTAGLRSKQHSNNGGGGPGGRGGKRACAPLQEESEVKEVKEESRRKETERCGTFIGRAFIAPPPWQPPVFTCGCVQSGFFNATADQ